MDNKKFQRRFENFVCENCGHHISGDGYTNHCPDCLWSKHVDINPGDRRSDCRGLMEPVSVKVKGGEYIILQRCQSCKLEKNIKAKANDNIEELIKISVST